MPNCAVGLTSCELKAASTADWMVAADVLESKILTFGPKSGVSDVGIEVSLPPKTLNS